MNLATVRLTSGRVPAEISTSGPFSALASKCALGVTWPGNEKIFRHLALVDRCVQSGSLGRSGLFFPSVSPRSAEDTRGRPAKRFSQRKVSCCSQSLSRSVAQNAQRGKCATSISVSYRFLAKRRSCHSEHHGRYTHCLVSYLRRSLALQFAGSQGGGYRQRRRAGVLEPRQRTAAQTGYGANNVVRRGE